jgi:hypothetical protein
MFFNPDKFFVFCVNFINTYLNLNFLNSWVNAHQIDCEKNNIKMYYNTIQGLAFTYFLFIIYQVCVILNLIFFRIFYVLFITLIVILMRKHLLVNIKKIIVEEDTHTSDYSTSKDTFDMDNIINTYEEIITE